MNHEISLGELVRLTNWPGSAGIKRPMPLNIRARMALLRHARKDTDSAPRAVSSRTQSAFRPQRRRNRGSKIGYWPHIDHHRFEAYC
ncbi:MAG: hypothetical protein WAM99_06155, partial [Xanthobacteraceae bacterium]